jgi:membrane protease YdiL (CAAX protease family)
MEISKLTHEAVPGNPAVKAFGTGVLTYFALTFAISWIGVLAVVGFDGFPGTADDFRVLLPMVVIAMLAGPSVAGVAATALFLGKPGLRNIWHRLLKGRVGTRWYVIALLAGPLTVYAVLTVLSLTSPVYRPGISTVGDPATHLVHGLVTGLLAGLFEEIGWTGFVIPRLRLHRGVFATGVIVGLVWGAWHLLVTWWGSADTSGSLPMTVYLPAMTLSFLVPFRVLMVWVYDRTGSLLIAMLMHATLTASVRIFDPVPISGLPIVAYNLALGASLWGIVAIAAISGALARPTATE